MTTITPDEKLITLINTFTVKPERADELSSLLIRMTDEVMKFIPGFISANIHVSLDKKYVTNYAQWSSLEDFKAMQKNPNALPHMKQCAELADGFQPILYEVKSAQGR
jgi:quinol monooxygenase YgiN